jgi:hypothetical protein
MSGERLHLGSGPGILEGWINIDVRPYPGVDRVGVGVSICASRSVPTEPVTACHPVFKNPDGFIESPCQNEKSPQMVVDELPLTRIILTSKNLAAH